MDELIAQLQAAVDACYPLWVKSGTPTPQASKRGRTLSDAAVLISKGIGVVWNGKEARGIVNRDVDTTDFHALWTMGYDIGKAGEIVDRLNRPELYK